MNPFVLCLWGSTGFVVLYFTYSLSTSSPSPLGHDSWRAGSNLCILLIFDNLSNESYIALSTVETHDLFVDRMETSHTISSITLLCHRGKGGVRD